MDNNTTATITIQTQPRKLHHIIPPHKLPLQKKNNASNVGVPHSPKASLILQTGVYSQPTEYQRYYGNKTNKNKQTKKQKIIPQKIPQQMQYYLHRKENTKQQNYHHIQVEDDHNYPISKMNIDKPETPTKSQSPKKRKRSETELDTNKPEEDIDVKMAGSTPSQSPLTKKQKLAKETEQKINKSTGFNPIFDTISNTPKKKPATPQTQKLKSSTKNQKRTHYRIPKS